MDSIIFALIFIQASIFTAVAALLCSSLFMGLKNRFLTPARAVSRNRFKVRRLVGDYSRAA